MIEINFHIVLKARSRRARFLLVQVSGEVSLSDFWIVAFLLCPHMGQRGGEGWRKREGTHSGISSFSYEEPDLLD